MFEFHICTEEYSIVITLICFQHFKNLENPKVNPRAGSDSISSIDGTAPNVGDLVGHLLILLYFLRKENDNGQQLHLTAVPSQPSMSLEDWKNSTSDRHPLKILGKLLSFLNLN